MATSRAGECAPDRAACPAAAGLALLERIRWEGAKQDRGSRAMAVPITKSPVMAPSHIRSKLEGGWMK